jgi:hypothetical protein
MPVDFILGWNDSNNHKSGRSREAVSWIVEEVANVEQLKESEVGRVLKRNETVWVMKGIHDDQIGAHITVSIPIGSIHETYHIYIGLKNMFNNNKDFVWSPIAVAKGALITQDFERYCPHTTNEHISNVKYAHYY